MLTFNKPNKLNGTQLIHELFLVGITLKNNKYIQDTSDGYIHLDIDNEHFNQAKEIVDLHIGQDVFLDERATEKQSILDRLGITADEAKLLLS